MKEFMDLTPDENYDLSLQCAPRERLVEECKTMRRMLCGVNSAIESRPFKPLAVGSNPTHRSTS